MAQAQNNLVTAQKTAITKKGTLSNISKDSQDELFSIESDVGARRRAAVFNPNPAQSYEELIERMGGEKAILESTDGTAKLEKLRSLKGQPPEVFEAADVGMRHWNKYDPKARDKSGFWDWAGRENPIIVAGQIKKFSDYAPGSDDFKAAQKYIEKRKTVLEDVPQYEQVLSANARIQGVTNEIKELEGLISSPQLPIGSDAIPEVKSPVTPSRPNIPPPPPAAAQAAPRAFRYDENFNFDNMFNPYFSSLATPNVKDNVLTELKTIFSEIRTTDPDKLISTMSSSLSGYSDTGNINDIIKLLAESSKIKIVDSLAGPVAKFKGITDDPRGVISLSSQSLPILEKIGLKPGQTIDLTDLQKLDLSSQTPEDIAKLERALTHESLHARSRLLGWMEQSGRLTPEIRSSLNKQNEILATGSGARFAAQSAPSGSVAKLAGRVDEEAVVSKAMGEKPENNPSFIKEQKALERAQKKVQRKAKGGMIYASS
jgi:hypothetical protein